MKKLLKKITILSGIIWILIFTIWLALSSVLLIKKDEIGRYLILYVNQIQNGELYFEQVSFSPLRQFPRISVILENVTYYEHKQSVRSESEQPIARIDNFYCGLEILNLFKGKFKISKVNVNGGEMAFVIYPDSSVNLINALKSNSASIQKKSVQSKKTESKSLGETFAIEKLDINNLRLKVTNDPDKKESSVLIKNFESEIDLSKNEANLNFKTSILIEKFKVNEDIYISNQEINLNVLSHLEKGKGLQVKEGSVDFAGTTFRFNGSFNPSNGGDLSLKIESDGSLNIFSLFVKEIVAKNLKKGSFYFFGLVEGKTFNEFPLINIDFGFKDVELINPITNRTIKNLNLKGFFNSERNKNLSQAILKVDTLFADLPNGQLKLSGLIKNFTEPKYDINLFLDADVTGLDEVFKLANIDSLNGKIVINDRIKGVYDVSEKRFNNNINEAEISFDDFGFIIPGTIRFDKINGTISGNRDVLFLKDLDIKSEGTDFNINGKIENINYLIFNIEKEITANLAIKSSVFDLPNFLSFDPSIKRDFPHRILDLDLLVDANTTTSKAIHFKSFPQIDFNIKKLNATAEGFLPPLNINSGKFKVSEGVLGFHMDFDEFKTEFLDGKLNFSADYNSSSYQPYYIKGEFEMDDLSLSKILFDEEEDSIPSFFKSKLIGSLFLELQFARDTTEIKLLNITKGNLNYFYEKDSIRTKSLAFTSENIDYNLQKDSNPLVTLFADGNIKASEIKTGNFVVSDSDFDFSVKDGDYIVETKKPKFFGHDSKGEINYSFKPFNEKPSFKIQCNITSFDIKEMMYTFLTDTIVSGKMNLSMDIAMQGYNWPDILSTMKGEINLTGKDLIFYGVDADKLIEKFQRSQNFNLVDAGAVLLAGPVGLAVTKGSDFAQILITNPGLSSHITQIVSNWSVKDGLLTLKDVAASTEKNRVAAKGWLNIATDSLNISFAVIDDNGCSIFTQNVYGDLNKPTMEKVKVVSALVAPVTNLYDNIMSVNCVAFYKGSLLPSKKNNAKK